MIPKRMSCSLCLRPKSHCICDLACHLNNQCEVLILQHKLEQKNAKGTARLLDMSLENSQLVVGETFASNELAALIDDQHFNLLLYPADTEGEAEIIHAKQIAASNTGQKPLRLIVLDGTWRKSRKLLHCNPLLAKLPRLQLNSSADNPLTSLYTIRKAHEADQLSTLEACCAALSQLEKLDTEPLLNSFKQFIARQTQLAEQGRAISGTITPN